MMPNKLAICPGSYDLITNSNLDIIQRCSTIFDEIIVVIFNNLSKALFFSFKVNVYLIKHTTNHLLNVSVDVSDDLLVDYAKAQKANAILRGLRAVSDFEYEMQITSMNKKLEPDIETIFMMTNNQYSFLSSSIVKEAAKYQGNITNLVPEVVENALRKKFS